MRSKAVDLCAWCREAVFDTEPRYRAQGRTMHEECMREFLRHAMGARRLAQLLSFSFEEGEADAQGA